MLGYARLSFTGGQSPHSTGDADGCSVRICWAGTSIDGSRYCATRYGGDSESGLQPAGASDNWRCLAVENLTQVELLAGPWQTAENHSRPQTRIEEVELGVGCLP